MDKDVVLVNLKGDVETKSLDIPVYTFNIDTLNPNISNLGVSDIKAINAGVYEYIEPLTKESERIAREFSDNYINYKSENLLPHSLERMICSWDDTTSINAQSVERFLTFNRTTQIVTLDDLLNGIDEFKKEHNDVPIVLNLVSERLHTNKKRLITYLILNGFQEEFGPHSVVSDSLNYLWREGHFKLFLDFFNVEDNDLHLITSSETHLPKTALDKFGPRANNLALKNNSYKVV